MGWLVVLGSISLLLIFSGVCLAIRRVRQYRRESEARRDRALAQMMKIGKNKDEGRPSTGLGTGRAQGAE